ncbi:hypothetical protein C2S53_013671 [Perilla frutescens var. hirtella]|uniref:Uncharacterized protein n=1 Tax=Perilla frutescens var. hirtella TaxID=608512 RepID=A0AAD4P6K8_PERFH|nr:hypothetical protein C2S53_013671 [Perilla frutescens var. hirtella]
MVTNQMSKKLEVDALMITPFYEKGLLLFCDLMSKKMKGVILNSATPYGVGVYEDDSARLKFQTLMHDYQDLQKDVDTVRSRLEAGKQRKMILAAEVRFLRKRFGYFLKPKAMSSLQKEKLVQPPNLPKQTKHAKEFSRKEASRRLIPPIPEVRPKKKQYISKQVALRGKSPVSQPHRKMLDSGKESMQQSFTWLSDLSHKVKVDTRKYNLMRNTAPILDLNKKERMHAHDTTLRYTSVAFDLNQDDSSSGKVSLPSRAPIFDLNEISTGDEDFQTNAEAVKFEEAKRSVMRHPNDEVQNDLMLSVCRNAGEGPARVGKRKISWQDPVALRV